MRPEGTRNANASLLAERSRADISRLKIEPLQFYNSYVTNNYAKNKSVYSMDFVKAVGLHSTASVNRAFTRLIDINILFKSGKEIRFVNPFFKAWLHPRGR
jgi:hypothetical protein